MTSPARKPGDFYFRKPLPDLDILAGFIRDGVNAVIALADAS
jgi:hypothetical protein